MPPKKGKSGGGKVKQSVATKDSVPNSSEAGGHTDSTKQQGEIVQDDNISSHDNGEETETQEIIDAQLRHDAAGEASSPANALTKPHSGSSGDTSKYEMGSEASPEKRSEEIADTSLVRAKSKPATKTNKASKSKGEKRTAKKEAKEELPAMLELVSEQEQEQEPEQQPEPELEAKQEAEPEVEQERVSATEPEPSLEPESEAEAEAEAEADSEDEVVPESEPEPESEYEAAPESEAESEFEDEAAPEATAMTVLRFGPKSQPPGKRNYNRKRTALHEADDEPEGRVTGNPPKRHKAAAKVEKSGGTRTRPSTQKTGPSHAQLLDFLLSDAAAELCRPGDESTFIQQHGSSIKTYSSSVLSPFEELVCAVVLSRPISHKLGQRTIRTILNAPYYFTTPKSIIDAGEDKVRQALEDAKTQHKDKTAGQINLIAKVVTSDFAQDASDTSLDKLRQDSDYDWWEERARLKHGIKGLGNTGIDIFSRRIQWSWEEGFPYVDKATSRGLDNIGLPKTADGLLDVLSQHWDILDTSSIEADDKEAEQRRAFVIICERATGADLERKADEVKEAAFSL